MFPNGSEAGVAGGRGGQGVAVQCEVSGVLGGGGGQIMQGRAAVVRTLAIALGWEATGGSEKISCVLKDHTDSSVWGRECVWI